jgi:hypothetical protein
MIVHLSIIGSSVTLAEISTGEVWMICLTAAMVGIMAIGTFLRKSEVRVEQPLDIKLVETLVSKEDFKELVRRNDEIHEQLFSKIGGVDRGAAAKISSEVQLVHARVNAIEKSIGGLEASTSIQGQRLAGMDAKIDRLIENL